MGALGVTQLVTFLLGAAVVAALCGYLGSAVARRKRNKRRARATFLLGFACGSVAGAILRERRHRMKVLGVIARRADIRQASSGILRSTYRLAARPADRGRRRRSHACGAVRS